MNKRKKSFDFDPSNTYFPVMLINELQSIIYGYLTNSQCDQLPVGLIT